MRGGQRPVVATLALVSGLLFAGCQDSGVRGFTFENRTTDPVSIVFVHGASEDVVVKKLEAGGNTFLPGWPSATCGRMLLIARDPQGAEVARRDEVSCLDQTWRIAASPG